MCILLYEDGRTKQQHSLRAGLHVLLLIVLRTVYLCRPQGAVNVAPSLANVGGALVVDPLRLGRAAAVPSCPRTTHPRTGHTTIPTTSITPTTTPTMLITPTSDSRAPSPSPVW